MKSIFLSKLTYLVAFMLATTAAGAGVKGVGTINYRGPFGPSKEDKSLALQAAKQNALDNYGAKLSPAAYVSFQRVAAQLKAQLDEVILSALQLDVNQDKKNKSFTVVIEAEFNTKLIDSLMASTVPMKSAAAASSEELYMVFAFVARKIESKKAYDDKREVISVKQSENNRSEENVVSGDGTSVRQNDSSQSVKKLTTGGSTEKKAAKLLYTVSTSTEVDNAVNKVLSTANFETVSAIDAGLDIDALKSDYGVGNDISPATRRAAVKLCQENDVAFLAVANMDIGLPEKDPITGLIRVYVSVTGKISDLRKRFPKTVASLEAKPYAGVGSNAEVAEKNALNTAADKSARDLVEQLRAKGISL